MWTLLKSVGWINMDPLKMIFSEPEQFLLRL